jgi:hypothetical protein
MITFERSAYASSLAPAFSPAEAIPSVAAAIEVARLVLRKSRLVVLCPSNEKEPFGLEETESIILS